MFRFQSLYETAIVIENGTKLNLGLSALCLFRFSFGKSTKLKHKIIHTPTCIQSLMMSDLKKYSHKTLLQLCNLSNRGGLGLPKTRKPDPIRNPKTQTLELKNSEPNTQRTNM